MVLFAGYCNLQQTAARCGHMEVCSTLGDFGHFWTTSFKSCPIPSHSVLSTAPLCRYVLCLPSIVWHVSCRAHSSPSDTKSSPNFPHKRAHISLTFAPFLLCTGSIDRTWRETSRSSPFNLDSVFLEVWARNLVLVLLASTATCMSQRREIALWKHSA